MLDVNNFFKAKKTIGTIPAAGSTVEGMSDVQGRQVVYPYTVRDLVSSSNATIANGGSSDTLSTEVTLFASPAGQFSDMVFLTAANTSTNAIRVDVRSATAANIVFSFVAPASSVATIPFQVPYPQNVAGDTWTVQGNSAGFSTTTLLISALFVNNQ